ncbi:MAG: molybdate ABC transporter substrate-binding protein [Coriobacteriales bacterium]
MNRRTFTKGIVATAASLSLVACFGLAGCGGNSGSGDAGKDTKPAVELQVFAANSLEKALPEVQALYTEQTGVTFADTQFKASGDLVAQLEGGASADVLITASTGTMDKAVAGGFVAEGAATNMFVNDLVVVAGTDSTITISKLEDLASDSVTSIAIGDPNVVPAGKYAVQALESAGLCTTKTADDGTITVTYDKSIAKKINDGADKVGTVASYVNEGQCDVGLVYTSDLYRYEGIKSIFTTPADSHKDILYPGAAIADSANADAAAEFLDFCLNNADAQKIWQQYGFELA